MKKLKKYWLSVNFAFIMAMVFVLSSCARERGVVSYKSEKLRKQSVEIENSRSTGADQTYSKEKEEVVSASSSKELIILPAKFSNVLKEKSVTPAKKKWEKGALTENIVLKKLSKKLSPDNKTQVKRSNIDQKLKMAIIFGGIGVILLILGGLSGVFWILGTIAIVIGLVFLLLWAIENL